MQLSLPTKSQWVSVIKNAVLAGVAAVLAAVTAGNTDVKAVAVLGFMAALKVVEKLVTAS